MLRASADAINALVGGLDCDVEDEQAALELVLERQINRGAIDQAEASAEKGRLLSVQYAQQIRGRLAETARDVRLVDWDHDVPAMLTRSRGHLLERMQAEDRLLDHVRGGRLLAGADQAGRRASDADVARASGRIVDLLEECRRRHTELHGHLIDARSLFLTEQERQLFRPPAALATPDVATDWLTPVMRAPADAAVTACAALAEMVIGSVVIPLPRLHHLVADMLAPRRMPSSPADDESDLELAEEDAPALSTETIVAAAGVVADVGLPARLSDLLTACEPYGGPTGELAALITTVCLWAYAPDHDADRDDGATRTGVAERVLGEFAVAASDSTPLALPGVEGDDLVVAADPDSLDAYLLAAAARNLADPETEVTDVTVVTDVTEVTDVTDVTVVTDVTEVIDVTVVTGDVTGDLTAYAEDVDPLPVAGGVA